MMNLTTGPLRKAARPRRRGALTRGQSTAEVALCLPLLCFMVLGAVDYARVLNVSQRLAHAAHVLTLRLITTPANQMTPSPSSIVAAESGLPGATASVSYVATSGSGGNVQAVVTARYDYALLLPGLQSIRTAGLSDGRLHVTAQAAGVAATAAPALSTVLSGNTPVGLSLTVPNDASTAPSLLSLTCVIDDPRGNVLKSTACAAGGAYTWTPSTPPVPSGTYTAQIIQPNGIRSQSASVTVQ